MRPPSYTTKDCFERHRSHVHSDACDACGREFALKLCGANRTTCTNYGFVSRQTSLDRLFLFPYVPRHLHKYICSYITGTLAYSNNAFPQILFKQFASIMMTTWRTYLDSDGTSLVMKSRFRFICLITFAARAVSSDRWCPVGSHTHTQTHTHAHTHTHTHTHTHARRHTSNVHWLNTELFHITHRHRVDSDTRYRLSCAFERRENHTHMCLSMPASQISSYNDEPLWYNASVDEHALYACTHLYINV